MSDLKYTLCCLTGFSYEKILSLIATAKPISRRGVSRSLKCRPIWLYQDDGLWAMLIQWMKIFIPDWEREFRKVTNELMELPDPAKIVEVAAKALNIAPDVLLYYAEHKEEIETFLETQRGMLGTIAEVKLWELVATGDAATIRWLLPRIKSSVFGEIANTNNDKPQAISIIEVSGPI